MGSGHDKFLSTLVGVLKQPCDQAVNESAGRPADCRTPRIDSMRQEQEAAAPGRGGRQNP